MECSTPAKAYAALVADGRLQSDKAQAEAAGRLQALAEALGGRKRKNVPGLYLWGNVGRGKSMLMDLFFVHAPVEKKRRVHFHAFMQEVHARIHAIRGTPEYRKGGADPVMVLVQHLAGELQLLCFDELQATDVADASLIFRLFEGLMEAGVTIVSTSNHPPETLYTGGVQRERFAKLTSLIREKMEVVALTSPHDYRQNQAHALHRSYFWPLGLDAGRFVEEALNALAPGEKPQKKMLPVQGREVAVTLYGEGVARASFADLCETALGPADYLAIAQAAETLILTGVPLLTPEKRNEAKRFVTLIDTLYEAKARLLMTLAAPPAQLYPAGDGSFEFQRTVSRLAEMEGERYQYLR